jgi:hypothetical protein
MSYDADRARGVLLVLGCGVAQAAILLALL